MACFNDPLLNENSEPTWARYRSRVTIKKEGGDRRDGAVRLSGDHRSISLFTRLEVIVPKQELLGSRAIYRPSKQARRCIGHDMCLFMKAKI